MPMIEQIGDYKIFHNMKMIKCHNPVSGHVWTESEPIRNSFYITGPGTRVNQAFGSIKEAKGWIEFYNKYFNHNNGPTAKIQSIVVNH